MEIIVMTLFVLEILTLTIGIVSLYFIYTIYTLASELCQEIGDEVDHIFDRKEDKKSSGKRKPVVIDDEKAYFIESRQKQKSQPYL